MLYCRELIKRCARNYPHKTAYVCGSQTTTWSHIDQRSDRFASVLQHLGVTQGTTVAMCSMETIEVYEHFFACMKIGAVRVGLNVHYVWPELRHILQDSTTRILLVDARTSKLIDEHRAEIEAMDIQLIGYGNGHDFALDYETLLGESTNEPNWPELKPDAPLFYSYTSGTTGMPKGVILTQQGTTDCILHSLISFGLASDDIWYQPAASTWIAAIMSCFNLGNGMTTVIPDGSFQVAEFLRSVERDRVTVGLLVPAMIQRVIAEYQSGIYDISSWRLLVYGSSPATPMLIRQADAILKVDLLQTYAMTEATGGWVSFLTAADHQRGLSDKPELLKSVGRIGIHFECSIRNDKGHALPPNSRGEIWLRSSTLMQCYLNLPEETAQTLHEGWLRTNDIGYLDNEGYLYLLDRQKFMIISGGVNVFPTAVEAVLAEHACVQEVAVIGVPHPEWGEAVVAVVVTKPAQETTIAELIDFCREKLSSFERPKYIVFVETLPKTPNAKVKKTEIKKWLSTTKGLVPWNTVIET
ncbi:MAG TPA: AMP-binding protein [Rugosibacter sp.]